MLIFKFLMKSNDNGQHGKSIKLMIGIFYIDSDKALEKLLSQSR